MYSSSASETSTGQRNVKRWDPWIQQIKAVWLKITICDKPMLPDLPTCFAWLSTTLQTSGVSRRKQTAGWNSSPGDSWIPQNMETEPKIRVTYLDFSRRRKIRWCYFLILKITTNNSIFKAVYTVWRLISKARCFIFTAAFLTAPCANRRLADFSVSWVRTREWPKCCKRNHLF